MVTTQNYKNMNSYIHADVWHDWYFTIYLLKIWPIFLTTVLSLPTIVSMVCRRPSLAKSLFSVEIHIHVKTSYWHSKDVRHGAISKRYNSWKKWEHFFKKLELNFVCLTKWSVPNCTLHVHVQAHVHLHFMLDSELTKPTTTNSKTKFSTCTWTEVVS